MDMWAARGPDICRFMVEAPAPVEIALGVEVA